MTAAILPQLRRELEARAPLPRLPVDLPVDHPERWQIVRASPNWAWPRSPK